MSKQCTEESFLNDIQNHEMIVIRDDGLNRHVRFKRPNTICMHFDLITWPGHLCYTGDMGTYVFARIDDMFEFFRADRNRQQGSNQLQINRGYWTEKLIAVDGNRGGGKIKVFDADIFTKVVNEFRVKWVRKAKRNNLLGREDRRELWEAVEDSVLAVIDNDGYLAMHAAHEFNHVPSRASQDRHNRYQSWYFDDIFAYDFTQYTHSIVWCCYALAWGIGKYDLAKQEITNDH